MRLFTQMYSKVLKDVQQREGNGTVHGSHTVCYATTQTSDMRYVQS